MTGTGTADTGADLAPDLSGTSWRMDPDRSSVTFAVPHFWGMMTVRGRFTGFRGSLEVTGEPSILLEIEAASVDTGNRRRDTHLRSDDFFDAEHHPLVTFTSEQVGVRGSRLDVTGVLRAAGNGVRMSFGADLRAEGDDLVVEVTTTVDQRELGMTWSPMGIMRTPTTMSVHAHLVPERRARG